jgi:hypothetical protein
MVSVDAPCRILINGQSSSSDVPATCCCEVADDPEKKLETLSLREGSLGGGEPAGAGGGDEAVELPPSDPKFSPPPEQPETRSASSVAIEKQRPDRIG